MSGDRRGATRDVDVVEAVALLSNDAVLLDVREPEETAAGRAPDAVTIPLGELGTRVGELAGATPIVVVCRTGNRSAMAAEALKGAGFEAVNLAGGMLAWESAGFPVVDDSGGPGFVL